MQSISAPWRSVKFVWRLMTLQKHIFLNEKTPMTHVYSQMEMVVFAFSITFGKIFFYMIPLNVIKHGGVLMLLWIIFTPLLFTTASCFAEMAALKPACGAHYHYCYSTICEFVAFIVGWHLVFAYSMITVTRCKFLSAFIDNNLLDGWIARNMKFTEDTGSFFICVPGYFDILSPMLAVSMAFQVAWAVKFANSTVNLFTVINVTIVLLLIVAFAFKMDFPRIKIRDSPTHEKLFDSLYVVQRSLMGYEVLSLLGDETKDPKTTIPLSIMSSVKILMVLYVIYTFTMTICVKKYNRADLDEKNPLGSIVILLGYPWLYWVTTVGSISSLWCSAYGSMFLAIRLLHAMARDGMILKPFSKVDKYTKKPALPALIFGVVIGLISAFVYIDNSVGSFSLLFAKIMSTICLLITRFRHEKISMQPVDDDVNPLPIRGGMMKAIYERERKEEEQPNSWILINHPHPKTIPTKATHSISMVLIYNSVISGLSSSFCVMSLYLSKLDGIKMFFKISGFCSATFFIVFVILLKLQPTNDRTHLSYITPHVPTFPLVAIVADFLSFLILCHRIWIMGVILTVLGIIFYMSYSIQHSHERKKLHLEGTILRPMGVHSIFDVREWKL